jgi:hypothetical protein
MRVGFHAPMLNSASTACDDTVGNGIESIAALIDCMFMVFPFRLSWSEQIDINVEMFLVVYCDLSLTNTLYHK